METLESSQGQDQEKSYTLINELDQEFKYEISKQRGGEHIKYCFACGTCTAGCPVRAIDAKYNPRKIIRMALLGMRDRVLSSDFIWLCTACYTCHERCPQDVRITDIMTVLRNMAAAEGYVHHVLRLQARLIEDLGRLYEIDDFDNRRRTRLGLPALSSGSEEVRRIFRMTRMDTLIARE